MSAMFPLGGNRTAAERLNFTWVLAIVGFLAMYAPVYINAAEGLWETEEQGHGAIVLAVLIWLFWTLRHRIDEARVKPVPVLGWSVFVFGVLVYLTGRIFDISILDFASQPFIVGGILLLVRGFSAIRVAWFPLFYFLFMIPLPSVLVDAITGSLKGNIANLVEGILYQFGYPIARSGVILSIGQYQLQVADACSGLHSMFSLSALGTLYMYLMGRKSNLHLGIMLAAILPIAFVANVVRVIVLVLVTYYFGDAAGQGFLHGAAGMVLMLVALLSLFCLDALLDRVLPRSGGRRGDPTASTLPSTPAPSSPKGH